MSDTVQTTQVTALEIPVTIQGSQIVPGTDRRELFTETTKTTLTLEKGAVVNLNAKVAKGQSLFLRNELSGREILCKVLEAPAEGQSGYTDLEFTVHDPEFWTAREKPQTAFEKVAAAQEALARAAESEVAPPAVTPVDEPAAPNSVEAPASPAENSARPIALPFAPSAIPATTEPAPEPQGATAVDDAKEAQQLAGIIASAVKRIAKRAAAPKEPAEVQENAVPTDGTPPPVETITRKQKAFSVLAFRLHAIRELTVRNNTLALSIVAVIVIGAAVGVAWDVQRMLYPVTSPSAFVATKPKRHASALAAAQANSATPRSPGATPIAAKIRPAGAQGPAGRIAKSPAATTQNIGAASIRKRVENPNAPSAFTVIAPAPGLVASDEAEASLNPPKHLKSEPGAPEMIPAKILSQYQPSLPPWAKNLDLYGVVTLDAVIDDKGNLKQTKLVSGPRVLESAAEAAVGLWIFQPATSDGKPTTSHMVLTVEFQR
jgi:Gram-negative bacterial TonB protein C-terminal